MDGTAVVVTVGGVVLAVLVVVWFFGPGARGPRTPSEHGTGHH